VLTNTAHNGTVIGAKAEIATLRFDHSPAVADCSKICYVYAHG
jgi:hypothetical protein